MSAEGSPDIWGPALTLLAGGTVAATAITLFSNWLLKRREERLDISKQKMSEITKSMPNYTQMASYYKALAVQLSEQKKDQTICLYYTCRALCLQRQLFIKVGAFQLDDLDAESILAKLSGELLTTLSKELSITERLKLTDLISETSTFDDFLNTISLPHNQALVQRFYSWLNTSNSLQELSKNCTWFRDLLIFEINHVYELWYGTNPEYYNKDTLKPELFKYLEEKHPLFANRIRNYRIRNY